MTDESQQLLDVIQRILERQSPLDLIDIYQRVRQTEHLDLSRFTSQDLRHAFEIDLPACE